jgi:hypothetical protein
MGEAPKELGGWYSNTRCFVDGRFSWMSELLKCKPAWVLTGLYLMLVLAGVLYLALMNNQNVIVVGALMVLTAPWLFLIVIISVRLGLEPDAYIMQKHGDAVFAGEIIAAALINAAILYLIVYLVTKAFRHFMRREF